MGKVFRRLLMEPALSANLMERIASFSNVKRAWQQVKANHGAPGMDGMTIEELPEYARLEWKRIRRELIEGIYQPSPVKRAIIPKPNGGERLLGIPTVIDRVIQQGIAQMLEPIFDPEFSEASFGFRRGRSAHDAVRQVQAYIGEGYTIAIEVDLKKFFDEVNHDMLMNRVARKVRDKTLLRLIGKYLRAGVMVNGVIEPTTKGVPQGGPLSPLLANIVLDDLDKELEKRGHRFVRYADDFVILVKSKRAGERVKQSITQFLEKKLKLKVNNDKSKVRQNSKCEFLGFTFRKNGTEVRATDAAFRDFKHEIRKLTGRSWGVSMEHRVASLNRYITGWFNYFGISKFWSPIEELDEWIRRRIRLCLWKQWRYARRKISELTKLGAQLSRSIAIAISGKSHWACSKYLATQMGLNNNHIHNVLGLVSIRDLWIALHYSS